MLDVDKKKNKKGNGSYLGEVLSKEVIFESKEVRHVNILGEVGEPGILGTGNCKCEPP